MKPINNRGFSLIEVMVTLVIVSVGMLALGSFYVTSVTTEGASQQRLAAIHMAEKIIEDWQNTNIAPTPDCKVGGVAAGTLALGTATTSCVPNDGIPVFFNILIEETDAKAPIPNGHLLSTAGAGGAPMLGSLLTDPTDNSSNHVKVRKVRVSWTVKGQTRKVLLTHITRKPATP